MQKDHLERRTYRKSPGRQYGYDYNPLRSRAGQSQSGQTESWSSNRGETTSRSSTLLVQRPDPRRTRQLLRQSIIASKTHAPEEQAPDTELIKSTRRDPYQSSYEETDGEIFQSRQYASRSGRLIQQYPSATRKLPEETDERELWQDYAAADFDEEEELDDRADYMPPPPVQSPPPLRTRQGKVTRRPEHNERSRQYEEVAGDDYADEEYEYEEDQQPPVGRLKKKHKLSRRGLLFGAGVAAVAGIGVAAYELTPKVPEVLNNAGSTVEHQVQDAFNKGVTQGANQARKELVDALDSLEGFSLDGAIAAASLTRTAYDAFVSPIVKFGSAVAQDFLNTMLSAFKTARSALATIYQDNATLQAIQSVLEAWASQVSLLPKKLNTVTQTDLDGAQAYLRALQRKIADEKAQLNNSQSTPTPTTGPQSNSTPTV